MNPIGMNNYSSTQTLTQPQNMQPLNSEKQIPATATTVTDKLVTLSDEGLAKQSAVNKTELLDNGEDKSFGDHLESFAYGTLGIDHPDQIEEQTDDSYTAGQYLKGALTVGGLLLAIV